MVWELWTVVSGSNVPASVVVRYRRGARTGCYEVILGSAACAPQLQFPDFDLVRRAGVSSLLEGGYGLLRGRVNPDQLAVVPLDYEVQHGAVVPEATVRQSVMAMGSYRCFIS